jgi:hypothetical protein
VEKDEVVGAQQALQGTDARFEAGHVGVSFRKAEVTAISCRSVQVVVDAFGNTEEAWVSAENPPARVDTGATDVPEQRPQHLGDAATRCSGVDVPDDATTEPVPSRGARRLKRLVLRGLRDVREAVQRPLRDRDVEEIRTCRGGILHGAMMTLLASTRGPIGRGRRAGVRTPATHRALRSARWLATKFSM